MKKSEMNLPRYSFYKMKGFRPFSVRSRDKKKVSELSQKGHIITQPSDMIKEPYVLEFLGLDEKAAYAESDLESAIINKLELLFLKGLIIFCHHQTNRKCRLFLMFKRDRSVNYQIFDKTTASGTDGDRYYSGISGVVNWGVFRITQVSPGVFRGGISSNHIKRFSEANVQIICKRFINPSSKPNQM